MTSLNLSAPCSTLFTSHYSVSRPSLILNQHSYSFHSIVTLLSDRRRGTGLSTGFIGSNTIITTEYLNYPTINSVDSILDDERVYSSLA
jgi:hypothetical protein